MKTVNATEVKNRFGQYLETSLSEPVVIEKTGRAVAVMISMADYERLSALEDSYWAQRALEAEKSGFLDPQESLSVVLKK
ncbi:MAG: type II toxin-antitoxin system Phd/YefM family antitoxin [Nitrospirae bacterium]|nr:type II toxin-antitoxin system Phd/YefM family antitoxin [Nitrospirota bacterium]MBF0521341.1 type II toxin-antitoxin system Phd/YefM family antitoxin [Nitrospirota bacterium]MBF0535732.1 type II toxin-antitoxin system Phd/YefM family antitoxin [Nitrospirota bacterium]MBF0617557.1 type II toxin-antitoxin system Phd/YefM family antitoxin [Nitrospirota bacterium]